MVRPRIAPGAVSAGAAPAPRRPSVPRLAWLLVCDPGRLGDADLSVLCQLRAVCPPAATASPLLQKIGHIVTHQQPEGLDAWLDEATRSELPDLVTFANSLRRDRSALLAALTLPWSTGPVEGHITRLIKRQGYGRAGLETLKRRFLHHAA